MMTIAEIAKQLKIPESTIRSWRDRYAEFIPSEGEGRKKRYKPSALRAFEVIGIAAAEGLSTEDIAERLSFEFTRSIEISNKNSSNSSAATGLEVYGINRTLNKMAAALELLADQQRDREKLQLENEKMRLDLDEMRKRLDDLEQLKAPWYKRKRKQ